MRYELLEHTADSMIKAYGSTLEECFENAAYAMFDLILDAESVEKKQAVKVSVEGEDREELLYIFDAKKLALSEFRVSITDGRLSCVAEGEPFDPRGHSPKTEIKAVTYHMLKVDPEEPSVTVLFDI